MSDGPVSPAVKSLLAEQADQSIAHKTRLDRGLEDTFPASDPVSATHTATASTATRDEPAAELLGLHPLEEPDEHRAELKSLQRDVIALRGKIVSARHRPGIGVAGVPNLIIAGVLLGVFSIFCLRTPAR